MKFTIYAGDRTYTTDVDERPQHAQAAATALRTAMRTGQLIRCSRRNSVGWDHLLVQFALSPEPIIEYEVSV